MIEPKIVGGQLGIHPIVALMSMFIGATYFGILGLFGFPITLSLLKHLNDEGIIKVFK
ncbi:AI-2E family transporter [Gudongella oleilytica]|jgi:predicted PurR-regulated permease PerM|nr:AI-2E family transporter [Gudongella oleilytica]MDY0256797.1 AI-2E family transporter [Gudongella oleilytica]